MPFRAYIRTFDGAVSEKTLTNDPQAALAAFEALVNRAELDGQKLAAALTGDSKQIAFHRFDRKPGDADYWRDRIDEIEMPGFGKVGRPRIMEDARRRNISIDDASWEIAQRLGDGNASDGIRKALQVAVAKKVEWVELDTALRGTGVDPQQLADRSGMTIIEDADAATAGAPCWYGTLAAPEVARKDYETAGGTVSSLYA